MTSTQDFLTVYDVIIVGAGPCGLAVAARLRESTPSALFTDVEHQRYHWIQRHKHRTKMVRTKGRANNMVLEDQDKNEIHFHSADHGKPLYSIKVLDSSADSWMAKWKGLFKILDIAHLRSPLFFHPDPRDRDGLKAWAYAQGRENELLELKGVVGKELSKHHQKNARKRKLSTHSPSLKHIDEREKQDYFTPSTPLFNDFCQDCINRYSLDNVVQQTDVSAIHFYKIGTQDRPDNCFTIQTSTGTKYSRAVVLAIGGGSPAPLSLRPDEIIGACHSSQLKQNGALAPHVRERIESKQVTNVIVVGGGFTSAQIADLCIRKGVSKVWHIMRDNLKIKHFDLAIPWVAKYKNANMSAFWSADTDEERIEMMHLARNRGAITPAYKAILDNHQKRKRLERHMRTEIVQQSWDQETKTWKLVTEPQIPDLPAIDYIYYATGTQADVQALPLLQSFLKNHPIPIVGGLPCLTEDMQWNDDVPLFVTGRFAGLRLGPGAANLEGARTGAERIAWRLEEILNRGASGDLGNPWVSLNIFNELEEDEGQ